MEVGIVAISVEIEDVFALLVGEYDDTMGKHEYPMNEFIEHP